MAPRENEFDTPEIEASVLIVNIVHYLFLSERMKKSDIIIFLYKYYVFVCIQSIQQSVKQASFWDHG